MTPFEPVYTVWDYYDGPRSGIAEYLGLPHHYICEFDGNADDYTNTFILTPIDSETLSLATEQWTIWRVWEAEFHQGKVAHSTHPALPGMHSRYEEISKILKERLSKPSTDSKRMNGRFRVLKGEENVLAGMLRNLEVEWSAVK